MRDDPRPIPREEKGKLRAWVAVGRFQFYPMAWAGYTLGAVAAHVLAHTEWRWTSYLCGYAAAFLIEFVTVLTNEIADLPSDRLNRHSSAFTGGSRVLVTGGLQVEEVRRGRLLALCVLGASTLLAPFLFPNPAAAVGLGVAGLFLGIAYSANPWRLVGRGVGEWVVAVAHSFVVVVAGFVCQGASLTHPLPWLLALPLCFAVIPSITLGGFPDFEADEATGKRTLVVRIGRRRAAVFAGTSALLAAMLPLWVASVTFAELRWVALPAMAHAVWFAVLIRRYLADGAPEGRMNRLLFVSLAFMGWFAVLPLATLAVAGSG